MNPTRVAVADAAMPLSPRIAEHAADLLTRVVTLTGHVGTDLDRWRLDDAIRVMPGVPGLVDETMVVPDAPRASPDADTARPWFPGG